MQNKTEVCQEVQDYAKAEELSTLESNTLLHLTAT